MGRYSVIVAVSLVAGCEPGVRGRSGVTGTFGGTGLGPGDFSYPRAITVDRSGAVFVVDKSGRVQRFAADGTFELLWRTPAIAQGKPVGLAAHPDGRVFVADTHYHRVLIYSRDGALLGSFGREGHGDGEFQLPTDVAFDADGFIYVSEYHENDRITKWSPDLVFVQAIGEAPIDGKRLSRPAGIDIDDEGTLWVADACNHRIVRFSLTGEVLVVFGRFGKRPGELRYPYDICVAPDGTVAVCEFEGNRVQWFTKAGRAVRTWGRSGRALGELFAPWGIAYGSKGRLYVLDSLNQRVQIVRP
ncbi:MAG: hypothetical protein ACE5E6_11480 [Phycisphaerae bacterium]